MAYVKTGRYHYCFTAAYLPAAGLVAIKRAVDIQDHFRGYDYHAAGAAAIGTGVLFAAGF